MFSTFITVALFVSLAIQRASAGYAINSPDLEQCTPAKVSWSVGDAPYTLELVLANDPCGPAVKTISNLNTTIYRFTTNLKQGTEVLLYVSDSSNNEAWSDKITIKGGSKTNCTSGVLPFTTSSASSPAKTSTPASSTPNQVLPGLASPTQASPSHAPSSFGGALNANASSGVLAIHRASMPLLLITALAAILALTL